MCFQCGTSVVCRVFVCLMLGSVGLHSESLRMGLCLGSRRQSTHRLKPWTGRLNRIDQFLAKDQTGMRRRPGDSALEPMLCCGRRVLGKGAATSAAPSNTPASSQHVVHRSPSPCVVTSFLRRKDRKRLPANHVTTQNNKFKCCAGNSCHKIVA